MRSSFRSCLTASLCSLGFATALILSCPLFWSQDPAAERVTCVGSHLGFEGGLRDIHKMVPVVDDPALRMAQTAPPHEQAFQFGEGQIYGRQALSKQEEVG